MATLEYLVRATDQASGTFSKIGLSADKLDHQLGELSKRIATPTVDLKDKEFALKMAKAAVNLDRLSKKVANPKITPEGLRSAELGILKLDAMLDKLDGKEATVTVDVNRHRGIFGRLGGGLAGLLGAGGPAGLGTGIAGLGGAGPYVAGAGALLGATLAPAALPVAGGLGIGALGAFLTMGNKLTKVFAQVGAAIKAALAPLRPLFTGVFEGLADFVKSEGPQLRDVFRASVPYLRMFVQFGEQAAKTILPVITQSLKQMQPFLPLISKGLMNIVDGFAGFIKAIGPSGMQASAKIFVVLTKIMAGVLVGLGHTINWLTEHIPDWVHNIAAWWDRLRHATVAHFDAIRNFLIGWWHALTAIFNAVVRAAQSAWNILVGATRMALGIVVRLFFGLPDRAIGALFGLGHRLYAFARAALGEFWAGFRSIGGSVISWIGNFARSIWDKVKSFFGIASPSSLFYDIGKNLMLGLFHGIKDHAHHAIAAAGAVTGAIGGDALANQALARRMFPWGAPQWPPFVSLVMAESGFNRFARNPSSGAYGIPQALPESKLPFAGQAAGGSHAGAQLAWMFSYIAGRYGTPAGAWAHELAFHWYGSGLQGGIFTRPALIGVGDRPERVDITPLSSPRGGGGEQRIVLEVHGGGGEFEQMLATMIRKYVRVRGGDVQTVFGRT